VIMPGGKAVWSVAITSPGAKRVRVHFRDFDVGSAEVWVYAPGRETARSPYSGKGVFADGEFWSTTIEGDTAIVALVRSNQSTPAQVPFVIDAITHEWADLRPASTPAAVSDPAAPCNLDVTCYPSYSTTASGVVLILYINDSDGLPYVCSGSMVNTRSGSFKPYFLTAHHCIGSNSEARTIQAYFFSRQAVVTALSQRCRCQLMAERIWLAHPLARGISHLCC
jgi:hypothetical protein